MKTAAFVLLLAATAGEAFVLGRPLASVPPTPLLARRTHATLTKGGAFGYVKRARWLQLYPGPSRRSVKAPAAAECRALQSIHRRIDH